MEFKDFCQNFYFGSKKTGGLSRVTSQAAIAEYILLTACNNAGKLSFSDDYFRKLFTGERSITRDLLATLEEEFDEGQFTAEIRNKLNDSTLTDVMKRFNISVNRGSEPNKHAFAAALASQFAHIIRNEGVADNVVASVYHDKLQHFIEFPQYVEKTRDKYSKLKTLLYTSEEKPFYDFFVCNTIMPHYITGSGRRKKNRKSAIVNVTPELLLEYARYVLLVGMGGIGKSMMMRHLFLTALDQYGKTGIMPILITLREFASENAERLDDLIIHTAQRFDITITSERLYKMLQLGQCVLLLDGYDEIRYSEMEKFQHELEMLVDKYPRNQFIMSSREMTTFNEIPRFSLMGMMPFSKEQSCELVEKLDFCEEEPNLKRKFLEQLKGDLFVRQEGFATNPLLLTLMMMNYRRFAGVPEKMHLFYEEAYETLLMRHDADKIAYQRVFHSVNDPADFTTVFREFCAKSYRKGDYEFDKKLFEVYFNKLKSIARLDRAKMKMDKFLLDVLQSVCMMYEEGQSYHFIHRSFQEYFFADYYSRQDDTTLMKLGESLDKTLRSKRNTSQFGDAALDMLYELAPDKVERFIILPYLQKSFALEKSENVKFWNFMVRAYGGFIFSVFEEQYQQQLNSKNGLVYYFNGCIVDSMIYRMICKRLSISSIIEFHEPTDSLASPDLAYEALVERKLETVPPKLSLFPVPVKNINGKLMIDSAYWSTLIYDEEGNSLIRGYQYRYHFADALSFPDQHQEIISQWSREDYEAKKIYRKVQQYYLSILDNIQQAEDDDF